MATMGVDDISRQVDSRPNSTDLVCGLVDTMLCSSNEQDQLSQRLYHNDSTKSIMVLLLLLNFYPQQIRSRGSLKIEMKTQKRVRNSMHVVSREQTIMKQYNTLKQKVCLSNLASNLRNTPAKIT